MRVKLTIAGVIVAAVLATLTAPAWADGVSPTSVTGPAVIYAHSSGPPPYSATVTYSNTTAVTQTVTASTSPANWSATPSTSTNVAAGANLSIQVSGTGSALLTVLVAPSGESFQVPLNSGCAVSDSTALPTISVDFGDVAVGSSKTVQYVLQQTPCNFLPNLTGGVPTSPFSAASVFVCTGQGPQGPGPPCTISFTFAPTSPGSPVYNRADAYYIGNGPQAVGPVTLTGNAGPPPVVPEARFPTLLVASSLLAGLIYLRRRRRGVSQRRNRR